MVSTVAAAGIPSVSLGPVTDRIPAAVTSAGHTAAPQLGGQSLKMRGSCVVSTVAAAGIPLVTGPRLSLLRRASWDERGWSRHDEVEAGSAMAR